MGLPGGPPAIEEAPSKDPVLHNLLESFPPLPNVVDQRTGLPKWIGGFRFRPTLCAQGDTFDDCFDILPGTCGQGAGLPEPISTSVEVGLSVSQTGPTTFDLVIDDSLQSGVVSTSYGAITNSDGPVPRCISPAAAPDSILYAEFIGAAQALVLEIPLDLVTAFAVAPSGSGAAATVSIDTSLTTTCAGLNASLVPELFETLFDTVNIQGDGVVFQVVADLVRCDTIIDVPADAAQKRNPETLGEEIIYKPFTAFQDVQCTAQQYTDDAARLTRIVLDRLAASKSKIIEDELWEGGRLGAANPAVEDPNMSLVGSVDTGDILNGQTVAGNIATAEAQDPKKALANLVQFLSNCDVGARGVIHATPYLVSLWSDDLLHRNGRVYETKVGGHVVVAGTGYTGSGPLVYRQALIVEGASQPEGTQWAYATSKLAVRLSDPEVQHLLDGDANFNTRLGRMIERGTNDGVLRAECQAAVVWDECCTAAVLVDGC